MKAVFIYRNYFDHDGKEIIVGGIETYISHLSDLCFEMGIQPYLIQCANKEFVRTDRHLKVIGVVPQNNNPKKDLFESALK